MALVPKVVSNTLNELVILEDVLGFAGGQVRIPALASNVDLTTMATEDALAASYHLAHLANAGDITVGIAFNVNSTTPVGIGGPYSDVSATSPALLAASTITASGDVVINGGVDLTPGSAVTGFPPATYSGILNVDNAAASAAKSAAQASFTAGQSLGLAGTVIASALDGQTLNAGSYQFASGAATLAASAPGSVTFHGSATAKFVVYTASTLGMGAGGAATVLLTGGALASNILWVVGSSATLNGNGTDVINGNMIAQDSISQTGAAGTVINGSLSALTGAITFASATTVTGGGSNFTGVIWS